MNSFKCFFENSYFIDNVLNEFNTLQKNMQAQQTLNQPQNKVWSAKKAEVLRMWRNLKEDLPIILTPMIEKPEGVERSSYGEDGVRITGSFPFIMSVLARLKQIISFENQNTKLRLIFRGVDKSKDVRPDRQTFVFYINLENRGKKRPRKVDPLTVGLNV